MYKVFHVEFKGHYIGGDAVIITETKRKAYNLAKKELAKQGLGGDITMDHIKEIDIAKQQCLIIDNGDY